MLKKNLAIIFVILTTLLLFFPAACKKAECKTAADCIAKPKTAFTAQCVEKKCVYTPIPNTCGNEVCEITARENKCTCARDCGACAGAVPGSTYLVQACMDNECVEDIPPAKVKPAFTTSELTSLGDWFKLDTTYSQPFNMKKDLFKIKLSLTTASPAVADRKITSLTLEAMTKDRRTITIGEKTVNKHLWTVGSSIEEEIIISFPTAEVEGELTSLVLKINYDYSSISAGKKTSKSATIKNTYKEKFIFVNPKTSYPCPASCDDGNPGTRDYCGPETSFFCKHEPMPGACGNFICEVNENKCTCPADCGPCAGSAGNYLDYACKEAKCITVLKPGATITPNSVFDERRLGVFTLNNYYHYNNPFNIKTDKFRLEFNLYQISEGITNLKIETVRLLDGTQVLASQTVNQAIPTGTPLVADIIIPSLALPEEEHPVTIGVWYSYTRAGSEEKGSFNKPLGKIAFISPG